MGMARSVANDVTMTVDGLWRYGDWRHVATGGTAVVSLALVMPWSAIPIVAEFLLICRLN